MSLALCQGVRRRVGGQDEFVNAELDVELNVAEDGRVARLERFGTGGCGQGGGHEYAVGSITGRSQVGVAGVEGSFVSGQKSANCMIIGSGRGHFENKAALVWLVVSCKV